MILAKGIIIPAHLSKSSNQSIMQAKPSAEDHVYSFAIAVGGLSLANELAKAETNDDRRKKKGRVVRLKRDLIREAFPEETDGAQTLSQIVGRMPTDLPDDHRTTLLIDLAFSNPFAPYELKFGDSNFCDALKTVSKRVGVPTERVDDVLKTKKEALKAHRNLNVGKVLAIGIGGAVLVGIGGYAAAPILAAKLGAAAGLSGAAATAHGLALLGGGTLAAGGAGMAGGLYLVTGTAIAVGGTAMGGGAFLIQLGAAGAKAELVKLQTSYREVLLHNQLHTKKASEAIRALEKDRQEVQETLDKEQKLNEKNSARLKDLEATVEALDNAIKWMKSEKAA
ncbi:hypothetical protein [Rubrivirga litoralis]|uniref:Uncharacterized protein n=1 Tax=Rubrivirga litoralis TaxID=3075598 RepID=A0ABU3BQ53_9BACT|nr:hypothetical protein [Rubrivirga sp. F394]MDT0631398.1 hypothetical protein [Rubrivirga sp. F394]